MTECCTCTLCFCRILFSSKRTKVSIRTAIGHENVNAFFPCFQWKAKITMTNAGKIFPTLQDWECWSGMRWHQTGVFLVLFEQRNLTCNSFAVHTLKTLKTKFNKLISQKIYIFTSEINDIKAIAFTTMWMWDRRSSSEDVCIHRIRSRFCILGYIDNSSSNVWWESYHFGEILKTKSYSLLSRFGV